MKPLVTMPDVLLACGELNKRERVAVQWVIDRYEKERSGARTLNDGVIEEIVMMALPEDAGPHVMRMAGLTLAESVVEAGRIYIRGALRYAAKYLAHEV